MERKKEIVTLRREYLCAIPDGYDNSGICLIFKLRKKCFFTGIDRALTKYSLVFCHDLWNTWRRIFVCFFCCCCWPRSENDKLRQTKSNGIANTVLHSMALPLRMWSGGSWPNVKIFSWPKCLSLLWFCWGFCLQCCNSSFGKCRKCYPKIHQNRMDALLWAYSLISLKCLMSFYVQQYTVCCVFCYCEFYTLFFFFFFPL